MTARIIDGKAIAAELRGRAADAAHRLARDRSLVPGLGVVLVGSNPASEVYVGSKTKATVGSGMRSFDHRLPENTSEAELTALIGRLNADPVVHGILLQLPLPGHVDAPKVIAAIDPAKDVDGLHPLNTGRLLAGLPAPAPCTPLGCIILAKSIHPSLEGLEAVVIGRSNLVGKPLAQLLLAENATGTLAHSKTADRPAVSRRADLLSAATGRPEMVLAAMAARVVSITAWAPPAWLGGVSTPPQSAPAQVAEPPAAARVHVAEAAAKKTDPPAAKKSTPGAKKRAPAPAPKKGAPAPAA